MPAGVARADAGAMNEEQNTQPPVPDDQPMMVLGADPSRVDAPYSGAAPDPQSDPAYAGAAASAGSDPQGGYPPPGSYPPPAGYQQPAAYPPPAPYPPTGAYQQPGAYPPPGPAPRLTRSRSQRVIGGVCGGLARYWNTDATLLRILTVVLTLATGGAFLVGYLIAWIAIPDEPMGPYGQGDQVGYAAGGNPGYAARNWK